MLRIAATCEGISPFLMNPATDELLDQLRGRVRPVKDKNRPVEEEAAEKLCTDADGHVGVSSINLFSSMIIAGRRVKNGKTQVSTASTTTLPGLLTIEQFFLPFKGDPKWVVDKRRGVNPKGGEMVCLIRPRFDAWSFDLSFLIDETEINADTVREVLRISGKFVGLGDFRPAKRGPFGRFRIASWESLGAVTDD
jgi:hypothetical protein